jgi:hypothetical protein
MFLPTIFLPFPPPLHPKRSQSTDRRPIFVPHSLVRPKSTGKSWQKNGGQKDWWEEFSQAISRAIGTSYQFVLTNVFAHHFFAIRPTSPPQAESVL